MNNTKKLMLLVCVLALSLMMVACGDKDDSKADPTPTTGAKATQAPVATDGRDLGGMEVVIGDWWTESEESYRVTDTTYQEEYWAYQDEQMAAHNYKLSRKAVASWSEMTEQAMLSITSKKPIADIIVLDSGNVASLLDKGMFADVSGLEEFNFKDDKWNQAVLEVMTVGDAVYGFAGSTEPRTGVFFNMDLFEQLGVNPELPYDLQAENAWDWAHFLDLCKSLTQDTNSDGVTDVYAIASFSADFFSACLLANGTDVVVKDENGGLLMNANDPAVLEALNFGRSLYDLGYQKLRETDPETGEFLGEWDWFVQAFQEQQTAMRVCEEYNVSSINQYDFKFGFVCFPQGPSADSLVSIVRENILIIPSCYDAQKIKDIAYVYDIYTNRAPGYEDDDTSWKASYETLFKDERAVSETLDKMINTLDQSMSCTILLKDYVKDWVYNIDAGSATPAEQIETYSSQWQTMVDDFNAKFE